jgi:hypothetical protein
MTREQCEVCGRVQTRMAQLSRSARRSETISIIRRKRIILDATECYRTLPDAISNATGSYIGRYWKLYLLVVLLLLYRTLPDAIGCRRMLY